MLRYINIIIITLGFVACEEIHTPDIDKQTGKLVFEGLITNTLGPHYVKISRSVGYNDYSVFEQVQNYWVQLEDKTGEIYPLSEKSPGYYESESSLKGLYNHEYRIVATSPEGKIYVSDYTKLLQAAPIESINGTYHEESWLEYFEGAGYIEQIDKGLQCMVSTNYSNYTPYYRYEYQTIFQTSQTYPTSPFTTTIYIVRPYNSALKGYLEIANGNAYTSEKIIDYPVCFISSNLISAKVAIDTFEQDSTGKQLFDMERVRYNEHGLIMQLSQYSLSEDEFTFWEALYKQLNASGELFDPIESQIVGNMHCENDSTETVFGYFGASALSKKVVHLKLDFNNQVKVTPLDSFPEISITTGSFIAFDFWVY
jgi:hypothetical protein